MKLRPILILLLFAASAGILFWIYRTATYDRRPAGDNPWAETMSDLDACSRRKHIKSVQYDHFANVAKEENFPGASRLFRAMALSERLQEHNCANVIVRLGGTYVPPTKVAVFRGTTDGNLERSIAYERQALGELHGSDIGRALERGNRYAARVLIWAAAGDMKHIELMERCRDCISARNGHKEVQSADTMTYAVCPECGNLYEARYSDAYCPICLTDGKLFIQVE